MSRLYFSTVFVLLVTSSVWAQPQPVVAWSRIWDFGFQSGADGANSLAILQDGTYALAGYLAHTGIDAGIVITRIDGERLSTLNYGADGVTDGANDLEATSDGGNVLAGDVWYSGGGEFNQQFRVIRLNPDATVQWTREAGYFQGGHYQDAAYGVCETSDNAYVAVGYSEDPDGKRSSYIVKWNSEGDLQWSQFYGTGGDRDVEAFDVIATPDGGCVDVGKWETGTLGPQPQAYIRKLHADGSLEWADDWGDGDLIGEDGLEFLYDSFTSISRTSDDGYIVAGQNTNNAGVLQDGDFFLMKFDLNGFDVWELNPDGDHGRVYDRSNESLDTAYSVKETVDGGFIVVGGSGLYDHSELNRGWMVKTDSDGLLEWAFDVTHPTLPVTLRDVEVDGTDRYIITGAVSGPGGGMFIACILFGPLHGTTATAYRLIGGQDGLRVQWSAVPGADTYDILTTTADGSNPSLLASTTQLSYDDFGLLASRFYRVTARAGIVQSEMSSTIGYVKIVATGGEGTVSTPFGLPFKFWEVPAGVPTYGVESTNPSDICDAQLNCGTALTADRILRQDNGSNAIRNSLSSCAWTGGLETSAGMGPGGAYWYQNRTGANRDFVLAGEVDNNGNYASITIANNLQVPYSWRDSRSRDRADLNLLESGFTGGTSSLNSDRVIAQVGGANFWRRTSDNTWQGTLGAIEPGQAYFIHNRTHANGTWTYTYEGD